MKTSDTGISLIVHFESCVLTIYNDGFNNNTIGYGHLITSQEEMDLYQHGITQYQAVKLLKSDLLKTEMSLTDLVRVLINQNQFDSMVSLAFNIGIEAFKNSTLLSLINKKEFLLASKEFIKWDHVEEKEIPGLKSRRLSEQFVFLGGSIEALKNNKRWFQ